MTGSSPRIRCASEIMTSMSAPTNGVWVGGDRRTLELRRGDIDITIGGEGVTSGVYDLAVANLTTAPEVLGQPGAELVHEPVEAFCTLAKATLAGADLRFAQADTRVR